MTKRGFLLMALVGCGGMTTNGDDASIDAPADVAIVDAGGDAEQCIPYVVPSDGGRRTSATKS
jgi:hypothetical protein